MSLINKYRPKRWEDVAGHEVEIKRLKGIIKLGTQTNAVLFAGPSGLGKTTLARMFANYMNCEKHTFCGECRACKSKGADIVEINGAANNKIDDMRTLMETLRFKPQHGKYRFVIIDEVQQLTTQAEQSFLTTLEEPPKHVIFLLCTMQPEKCGKALLTRGSYFDLQNPSRDQVVERLKTICKAEKTKIPESVLTVIAENSLGCVRQAVQLLEAAMQVLPELGKKSDDDVEKYLLRNVVSGGSANDDASAVQVLTGILTGDYKLVHRTLLEVNDFNTFVNKLSYLAMYIPDRELVGSHKLIWHTAANKQFYAALEKQKLDPKKLVKQSYAVLDEVNSLKYQMGSFMANNRHMFTTRLARLAMTFKTEK